MLLRFDVKCIIKKGLLLLLLGINLNSFAQIILFDDNWKFHRGGALGAESPTFIDSAWRQVDLPHDWSIEDLPGTNSPFDPNAISQVSGGYTVGGTGWYRKTFTISEEQKNKLVNIQFDGIYMNAEIWINGELAGRHPYGYTSFVLDITNKIRCGQPNIIAVKVMNEGQNSRWYSGSGIYRHVWLSVLDPVHIAHWGTLVTFPEVNSKTAEMEIKTTIENSTDQGKNVLLDTRIVNPQGIEVGRLKSSAVFSTSNTFVQNFSVVNPQLWLVETPDLYNVINEVYLDNQLVDRKETKIGIRSISFDAQNGFRLNGKTVKLKGGCVHHDNGPLGAKAYDRAEERRVELLKASGFNAVRCSHNPPSPAFLDACDRLGILVIDEAFDMWRIENNPYDYHLFFDEWWQKDIESMVMRDRNHPSVILWSIGNEIKDMENPEVIKVGKMLKDYIHAIEPTRPVTAAVNSLRPEKDPFFAILDVGGYNYATGGDHLMGSMYPIDHQRVPDRIMMGTESYPLEAYGAWTDVLKYPYLIGDFVWTAFDYIGEASIGWRGYWQDSNFFPWNLAWCGDIDICGWKRPQSFYRDALWKENQLSLFVKPHSPSFPENPNRQSWSKWHWHDVFPDWNWQGYDNQKFEVTAYSSCETTELFLNGQSLGKKETGKSRKYSAQWDVPFQAGELKAVGYNGNDTVSSTILKTSGETKTIKLTPDRDVIKADNHDLSYITVELTDEKGIRDPKDDRLLSFEIEGAGSIVGVGNANPMSLESYQMPLRKAWQGRCLVIVKSTGESGKIVLTAKSEGLPPSKVILNSIPENN